MLLYTPYTLVAKSRRQLHFGEDKDTDHDHDHDHHVSERLRLIRYNKIECIKRAKKLAKDHDVIWKEEILSLAQLMEEELLLLDQDWLISSISEEIRRIYRENQIKIAPYVAEYLPDRYKLGGKDKDKDKDNDVLELELESLEGSPSEFTNKSSIHIPIPGTEIQIQIHTGNAVTSAKKIAQLVEEMSRENLADLDAALVQAHRQCEKRSVREQIPLLDDGTSSGTGNGSSSSSSTPKVTTDTPPPKPGTLTQQALARTIKKLQAVHDRVPTFPAQILEKDREIALGWDNWIIWADSALDLKYSQTWMDWFKTEKYRDIYGKHAAAVMSFAVTNLCANCSDEQNKEWVRMEPVYASSHSAYQCLLCNYKMDTVCPKCNLAMKLIEKPAVGWKCSECEGTVPMKRDLTREQVGDKSSIIVEAALEILEHIPSHVAFLLWYNDWIQPYVAGRKKRLGPDLSEKA